eukprot:TRINITY_DN3822_c1_g1_i1.p1 TRINITY_DN3822_c1_g1~~TRINITY_DN3822_c1_g1_i1.p1  ORF type:complete len:403 (+),score=119.00 TRINITY_DN3822_c1_g1_i1:63-1211(+)
MEVTARDTLSGCSCVVGVGEHDTVLDIKTRALQAMFSGSRYSHVSAYLGWDDSDEGEDHRGLELHNAERIADTGLEDGGDVWLVRRPHAIKAPALYPPQNNVSAGMRGVSVSPCGTMCASIQEDTTLRVYDTTTSEEVATLSRGDRLNTPSFSPCGRWLAACSSKYAIHLWCAASWDLAVTLRGHAGWVRGLAWGNHGLVSCAGDWTVRVWDVAEGVCVGVLKESVGGVTVARGHIFTRAFNETIRAWDASTLSNRAALTGHTKEVTRIATAKRGEVLVSCSDDLTVKVWCTAALQCLNTLQTESPPAAVAVSPGGGGTVAVLFGTHLRVWGLESGGDDAVVVRHRRRTPHDVALSPCGRYIFVCDRCVCLTAVGEFGEVDA